MANFGLFVQIDAPFVEGLVKPEALGAESYDFDQETMRLTGTRSGRTFSLGDRLKVRVVNVDVVVTDRDGKPAIYRVQVERFVEKTESEA